MLSFDDLDGFEAIRAGGAGSQLMVYSELFKNPQKHIIFLTRVTQRLLVFSVLGVLKHIVVYDRRFMT